MKQPYENVLNKRIQFMEDPNRETEKQINQITENIAVTEAKTEDNKELLKEKMKEEAAKRKARAEQMRIDYMNKKNHIQTQEEIDKIAANTASLVQQAKDNENIINAKEQEEKAKTKVNVTKKMVHVLKNDPTHIKTQKEVQDLEVQTARFETINNDLKDYAQAKQKNRENQEKIRNTAYQNLYPSTGLNNVLEDLKRYNNLLEGEVPAIEKTAKLWGEFDRLVNGKYRIYKKRFYDACENPTVDEARRSEYDDPKVPRYFIDRLMNFASVVDENERYNQRRDIDSRTSSKSSSSSIPTFFPEGNMEEFLFDKWAEEEEEYEGRQRKIDRKRAERRKRYNYYGSSPDDFVFETPQERQVVYSMYNDLFKDPNAENVEEWSSTYSNIPLGDQGESTTSHQANMDSSVANGYTLVKKNDSWSEESNPQMASLSEVNQFNEAQHYQDNNNNNNNN